MANTDFRFDPFRQVFRPVVQTAEVHVAQYFDALGRVGFFTREAIQRRSPSSVVVVDSLAATLAEVSRTTIPVYATYRVDYSALTFWSHCFVELHETRIGEVFTITYHGLGTGLNSSNRDDDRFNIERSVMVEGDVTANSLRIIGASILAGAVGLGIGTASTVSMSGNKVENVESATNATDLTILSQFVAMIAERANRVEVLTSSGNWIRQRGVRYVFFVAVGGGGAGSNGGPDSISDSGGGGGAGSKIVYGIADLDGIGGFTFAYTIGQGAPQNITTGSSSGQATTIFGCSSGRGVGGTRNVITGVGTGGAPSGGTIGANVIGAVVNGVSGGNNSGSNSGAGGNAAPMFAQGNPLLSGIGGASVSGNVIGTAGSDYGAGGAGGGGHPVLDSAGGAGGNGVILLIY